MSVSVQLVLPAAGLGARLGQSEPKALVPVAGIPLLVRTLSVFQSLDLANFAIVLHPRGFADRFESVLNVAFPNNRMRLVEGGAERQDSVRIALKSLDSSAQMVILHDAARPFVSTDSIRSAIDAAEAFGGATVATPSIDTILESDDAGMLSSTPDRSRLWACQTPQVFQAAPFRAAHERAHADGRIFTDDATLFRAYGGAVKIVQGSAENRKITTNDDLRYAEYVIASRAKPGAPNSE